MKRQITFRLIAMLLTATLLLTSTGLLTMFAKAEETTTSPTLVTEGSLTTSPQLEMTTGSETTTASGTTTEPLTTTEPSTTTTVPSTTAAPETTTNPTVVAEGGALTPAGPTVNAEGFVPMNASPQAEVWVGNGTAGNPYQVSSTAHFLDMHRIVNDLGSTDKYFRFTANIDLSSVDVSDFFFNAGFSASLMSMDPTNDIDHSDTSYIKLDGDGFKLTGFNFTNDIYDTFALFGYLSPGSVVENINFEDCSLTVTNQLARVSAILAVQNKGIIRNCTFAGSTLATTLNMAGIAGDGSTNETFTFSTGHVVRVGHAVFVGDNQGTIENCRFTDISITVNRRLFIGTVTGQNSGTITGINGAVFSEEFGIDGLTITTVNTSQMSEQIGGIAGRNRPLAVIANCAINLPGSSAVNAFTSGSRVGGVTGVNAGAVSNCYVAGKVSAGGTVSGTVYDMRGGIGIFGGIAGQNTGSINTSSAVDIGMYFTATGNAVYGGIAGTNTGDGVSTGLISNSFASGKQSDHGFGATGYHLGGIVGSAGTGTLLSNCYALVSLSAKASLAGALIGDGAKNSMLSAANPNYWSRFVSGWPTQCALNGADNYDIQRGINVLKIETNTQASIFKNQFTHSWGGAAVEIPNLTTSTNIFTVNSPNLTKASESTGALRLIGGPTAGTFGMVYYNLDITLPAGVGATQQTKITQQMSVTAVVTAEALNFDYIVSLDNPIAITNTFEMLLLRDVNYASYRLDTNITMPTVAPNEWRTSIFSGTLDGSGHTITTHIPVFSKIYGSRDDTVPVGGGTDTAANLAYGYINNLNIVLTANTASGVLGSVMGGTVKNVKLTGSIPEIALNITLNTSNLGTFIDVLRGNSYVYGCFTDVRVNIQNSNADNLGGLIGNINGEKVTVENCGANSNIYTILNPVAVGSLIGGIFATTGTVKNCFAAGLVERGGNIIVGSKQTSHKLENVYWSIKDTNTANQQTVSPAPNISGTDTVIQWNFDENIGYVSDDSSYLNLILPAPITMLSAAQTTEFGVTVRDEDTVLFNGLSIAGGKLLVEIAKDPDAVIPIDTLLTVVHQTTGLVSRVVINDGIGKDAQGYYLIKTPGDLQYLTANQYAYDEVYYNSTFVLRDESGYLLEGTNFKIRLMADIDMTGYEYTPIGYYQTSYTTRPQTLPFTGVFDGNGHTITNLTLTDDPVTPTGKLALFAYAQGATISNFTLENMSVTSGNQYAACVAAVASGGIVNGITIKNSTVTSTFDPGAGQTFTGGVVGGFTVDTGNTATVSNITVEGLAINLTGVNVVTGFAGGIVGNIPVTPVTINAVNITDLDITGKQYLGGIAGYITGGVYPVTISNAHLSASEGNTPLISGTGYVGGIVGYSSTNFDKATITGCSVTGIAITNTGTAQTSTAATGGIAAWYSGTIENCVVTDTAIDGMIAGGIIGRIDISTNNRNATITGCIVKGTTAITGTDSSNSAAGGIFAEYLPTVGSGILLIDNCRVESAVTITEARYIGGILGNSAAVATPIKVEITNCQSFASITTGTLYAGYAGAIVGQSFANVNVLKILNCVGGGTINATGSAGGLLGNMQQSTAFNLVTAGGPHISGSYVTASLTATQLRGKIWGYNNSNFCLTAANIADAVNIVVYSSYPEDIVPYGRSALNAYADTPLTYADISRPDAANPTFYQHNTAAAVVLTDAARTATINATNLPANFARTADFGFAAASGWVTQSEKRLKVTSFTATQINVEAQRTAADTGVIAVYEKNHPTFRIYPNGTAEKITFRAKIPVVCQSIEFIWTGAGTFADPFRITNVYDLDEMRNHVLKDENNNDPNPPNYYFGGYYRIENDLDFNAENELEGIFEPGGDFYNEGKFFTPIAGGAGKLPFVGVLDGNGKTITGLKMINTGGIYTGLFEQSGKQTVKLGGSDVTVSANFSNLTINDATIEGDTATCTHAGTLVAFAKSTVFSGITVNNATVSKASGFAGGIVGRAAINTEPDSLCTLTNTTINASSVKALSGGMAGGIAGRFGGSIGTTPGSGYDIQVLNTAVEGDNAGGIVGYNLRLPLAVTYALVSGGSVESKITSDAYSAGGILGRADGLGDNAVSVTYSRVQNNPVKAVCVAGGIIGKMGVNALTTGINLLNIEGTQTNTAVEATAPGTGTSNAGGIAGNLTNALIVKITNSSAGGSVKGNKYAGGVIAEVEGTNPSLALTFAMNSLVSHTVVGAAITGGAGALTGLVLGYAADVLMPPGSYPGSYPFEPFLNIKYSSYQYEPGRNMIGNGNINIITAPNYDFKSSITDLNKGVKDEWIDPTYMGLRYSSGKTLLMGNTPISLDGSNILLPVYPGAYPLQAGGTYADFQDNQGQRFILDEVTSNIQNLVVYDKPNRAVSRGTVEGAGYLVYRYENGLELATNLIAFDIVGNGESDSPFEITQPKHFMLLRVLPNKYYIQMNNIAFSGIDEETGLPFDYFAQSGGNTPVSYYNDGLLWEPVKGSGSTYFTGEYNGNGKIISGMQIARPAADDIGFFARIAQGAKVYGLTIANATVVGRNYVGGLAGQVLGDGTEPAVSGCHVKNSTITATEAAAGTLVYAGGITAYEKSALAQPLTAGIFDCSVISTSITTSTVNNKLAAGIAALAQRIENCTADNITVSTGLYAGGIAARSSITAVGAGNPMLISGCTVSGGYGDSTISANFESGNAVAGGIVAFMNRRIQLTVQNCTVTPEVTVNCFIAGTGGSAGGIMGALTVPSPNTDLTLTILNSQSKAKVNARNEAGGVLGAVKGVNGIDLSNVLIQGCVGAGEVTSTGTSGTACAGGIIGGIAMGATGFAMPAGNFVYQNIASAFLTVQTGVPRVGKLVGNCASIEALWTYNAYPNMFKANYISTYPQETAIFGSGTMTSDPSVHLVATDLMYCETTGDPEETFMVQTVVDGVPSGDYRTIALATFETGQNNTTNFKAQLHVWNGVAPVELAANEPFTLLNTNHSISITGVSIATANAAAAASFTGSGPTRALNIAVTPAEKTSGYVEVDIGLGLKVAVPLVTFEISGTGVSGNPFQIANVEQLTLMYYLPSVYYKQVNQIDIEPKDYAAGVWNPATEVYDGRGILFQTGYIGFRPVGTQAKPFTGSYDGQNFKITGLYSDNREKDYIGFFGYVAGTASLRNIHLELRPNTATELGGILGKQFVGGLAGYYGSTAAVINCSVVFAQVAGKQTVGGLIGRSSASLTGCFTVCDVLAVGAQGAGAHPGEAGGLVGRVVNNTTTALNISKSFAAGSVFSGNQHAGGLVGRLNNASSSVLNVTDSFFTGNVKSADSVGAVSILLGSGDNNQGITTGSRLYAAGTNVSFKGDMRPFSEITTGIRDNIYYDNTMLGLTNTDQGTALTTAQMTGGTLPGGFAADTWSTVAGSYPRLMMKDSGGLPDDYANAFCVFATMPLTIDARELQNGNTLADGMRFQPQTANTIGEEPVNFTASKLDITDTLPYPDGYDENLTGNGADRNIDLLFGSNNGSTTIYRNILKSAVYPANEFNPLLYDTGKLLLYAMENGEICYDTRTPVVTMTSKVNGVDVVRRVKIPLESTANKNFYLATERQFRALSDGYETVNTKFNIIPTALGDSNARVNLTADVDLRGAEFAPIENFLGIFDGSGSTIKKLKITAASYDNIGLFRELKSLNSGVYVEVNNLNIEDAWVTGKNNVGALAGRANVFTKISNCSVYPSGAAGVDESLVSGGERIGGLVGFAEGQISSQTRSAVPVSGVNAVGGLVGVTSAVISNSFATGDVTAAITLTSAFSPANYAVGGFAGAIITAPPPNPQTSVTFAFASGNVTVSSVGDFENNPRTIGIGGFAGVIESAVTESACFSSGSVRAEDVGILKTTATGQGSLIFGLGGLTGVNANQLSACYSSSSVYALFNGVVLGTTGSNVAAGVGGVTGVALATVSDAYSSGSVLRDIQGTPASNANTYFENAVGGVIGTRAGIPGAHALLYFDLWNNSYGSTLTAIGGQADTIQSGGTIGSLTTDQLCISQAVRETNLTPLKLSTNFWSFNAGAYPALIELAQPTVSPYVRYPAVLSVIAVTPDERDISARTGNGITMAITTPNSLTVLGQLYDLDWSVSADSDVSFIETSAGGGTLSKFVPVRTANRSQILSLVATIVGNSQYGSRSFDRSCADMRGTLLKPYLISNKSDLQHIGLPSIGTPGNYGDPGVYYSATGFDDFYNQWYSPLNDSFVNVAGKVYFQLLSDIDMVLDVNYEYKDGKVQATVDDNGDDNIYNDNHYIPSLSGVSYGGIPFSGISFAGNDYSIDNFNSNREFLYGLSGASEVRDVSFNNLIINSVGTAEENNGTALVRYNFGIIDGCMINSGSITGGDNVAGIVAFNYATYSSDTISPNYLHQLTNSTVNANITGRSNVGGIAAKNIKDDNFMGLGIAYTGQITNSAFTGGTITVTQSAAAAANAGGIAGENSGIISNSFSMGSIISAAGADVIGGLVGVNAGTGVINAAYSRTNVSGGNNIGGFAGLNAGAITNAYSAGRVTIGPGATQTGIFCGTNTGTLTDAFADKAMAGKSTAALLADATATDCLLSMSCFDSEGTAVDVFELSSTGMAYPQLKAILALDDAYGTGMYLPQKYALLIGYSVLSSAAINTKYSQYIDTLPLGTSNPVSVITTTAETWLGDVAWATGDASIITTAGLTGSTGGTAALTASILITASNSKTYTVTLPISVTTDQPNPNFSGGIGSAASPYQINTAPNFDALSYYGPDAGIYYVLTGDVNYAGGRPATPIEEFTGHLDGQQFTVYDVTVDNNAGLFAHLNNGSTISNLGLVGAQNTFNSPDGYIGLLAGHAQGATITNCFTIGEINTNAAVMGGLVGLANASTVITGCMTSGKFVNTSTDPAALTGGIAGSADTATVTGCLSTAYVQGDGVVGGIVGEAVNSANITDCTFAGMAMDTALAGGATVPAITTIGNIAGSIIDGYTTDEPPVPIITATITNCKYDKQITLVRDTNAAAMFTAELAPGTAYTLPAGLTGGSAKFAAGVTFGTMPVRFMLGTAAGSMSGFSSIRLPGTVSGDTITVTEIPQHSAAYLTAAGVDPIILTLGSPVDLLDVYAGLEIKLNTLTGTVFSGMTNTVERYAQPRLSRIIKVTYTIDNASGNAGMDTAKVAVMVKNTHLFGGEPVAYTSDIFTTKNSTPALLEDLVVSSGGIYAAGELPEGVNYRVSAQDQNGIYLIGSAGSGVDLASYAGKYGAYIPLGADTTEIAIHYTIVSDVQWGVFKYWSSLVDTLA